MPKTFPGPSPAQLPPGGEKSNERSHLNQVYVPPLCKTTAGSRWWSVEFILFTYSFLGKLFIRAVFEIPGLFAVVYSARYLSWKDGLQYGTLNGLYVGKMYVYTLLFPFGVSRLMCFQSIRNQEAIWLALIILTFYQCSIFKQKPHGDNDPPWSRDAAGVAISTCIAPCANHGAFTIPRSYNFGLVGNKRLVKKKKGGGANIQLFYYKKKELTCINISLCKRGGETD